MSDRVVKLVDQSEAFFAERGSAVMMLTPAAAREVCMVATEHQLLVVRVEGGFWHNPGFEARLDCIWDGKDPPLPIDELSDNNSCAAEFIVNESVIHSAFILTVAPMSGYTFLNN